MDIIVSHVNADFDAFASMVAARRLYPDAKLVFPGSQEKKVRDFIESFHPVETTRLKDLDASRVKRVVIVDTKSPGRIGQLSEVCANPSVTVHIYDHHPHREGDIHGAVEIIEDVGATATIFAETFMERGIPVTPIEATLLCLGIYEETGNLMFPSTTERDLNAVAYLLKNGASLKIVSTYLKTGLSRQELDLLNELVNTATELLLDGVRVKIAKASRGTYLGDAAHLAHRMMDMEDIDALVLLLRMDGKVVMIGRSRAHELDVSEVLEVFGGGGHPTAASATIVEEPLEILEEKVSEAIRSSIKPGKVAADAMTKPVITIQHDKSIKDAEAKMTRYGVNVLPLVKKGLYVGLLSRETVEKAIFHGFKQSPALDFADTDAMTAEPNTPQREVEKMMIEHNQRFMPVLVEGEIVGAITRTDLLRAMYEDFLRKSRIGEMPAEEKPSVGKNLATLMRDRFPKELYEVLTMVGKGADELQYSAYLVGGTIRDLLRGERNLDIDIVIEGDGIVFARKFAKDIGARVNVHDRFSTAKIIKDSLRLDIATARTEYYETPAALPRIRLSSIKKDLYRRDFTINTLAVRLNPKKFGQLVDFFGGQRDLKDKTIRVLHNLSFVEDPTRAFRAIRFAERFNFKLSKQTDSLIKSSVKMDLFSKLTGSRIYEEMELIFQEAEPLRVLMRLSDYGLLGVLHKDLEMSDELERLLASVHDSLVWFGLSFQEERPDKATIYLMALASSLNEASREALLDRLLVPPKVKRSVLKGILAATECLRGLPQKDPAVLHSMLSGYDLETLLFAMSLTKKSPLKKAISHYLLDLRKVKPLVTGKDLKELGIKPGPAYSSILGEVLSEKLRGRLQSKEDEIRFVRKKLKSTIKTA